MKESCCRFGPRAQLVGVVSEPSQRARGATVVLVSAGVTPKAGPFRLYAELARRLAGDGFRTLRFDLGGIGDSGEEYGAQPLRERTRSQITDALDYLRARFDGDGFVLAGLCSGAEDSFRHAEQDPRVTRVVMVDPFAYRSGGFAWRHFGYRVRRRLLRAAGLYRPLPSARQGGLVDYEYMPVEESSRILRELLRRRVRLDFIYTGGMSARFNHRGQLRAMFRGIDFNGLVGLDYLPSLDHTQPLRSERCLLIETIARRLRD
jgi:pimeloyl-ACP methyl ester carboxylesterase